MNPLVGRERFFAKVAEGLLIPFGSELPNQVALKANVGEVPREDVAALAWAICKCHPVARDVIEATISMVSPALIAGRCCVINGEGERLADVAVKLRANGLGAEKVVIYNAVGDDAEMALCEYSPGTCADILFFAIQELFNLAGKQQDGLVLQRFLYRGFRVFQEDYQLFEQRHVPDLNDPEVTERLCARLSNVWRFRGNLVSQVHILEWLRQFEAEGFGGEARQLLVYLARYGYVTERRIVASLARRYEELVAQTANMTVCVAFQEPGRSESRLAYELRPGMQFYTTEDALTISRVLSRKGVVQFVCFDDCVGSGETVNKYVFQEDYNQWAKDFEALFSAGEAKLHIITYHSDPRGVQAIENHPMAHGGVEVHTVCPLDSTHRVFSDNSRIVTNSERRRLFGEYCRRIGEVLHPVGPWGWGDCQWCVSYDYSIPDTSLPILFASGSGATTWKALFPRRR